MYATYRSDTSNDCLEMAFLRWNSSCGHKNAESNEKCFALRPAPAPDRRERRDEQRKLRCTCDSALCEAVPALSFRSPAPRPNFRTQTANTRRARFGSEQIETLPRPSHRGARRALLDCISVRFVCVTVGSIMHPAQMLQLQVRVHAQIDFRPA
jgi:hypothetical protein